MSGKAICPRIGASIVPRWFLDVLHAVIYADGQDGYFTILALSAMIDARSPGDQAILLEWARGSSQTQIAAKLRMSRHRICRRMNAMRRRLGCATLRRLRGNQTAAEAFSLFAFGHCNETPNVRLVIDRLAELSPVELSVLSALLRFLPENETLASAGISRTWYYRIAAKLSAEFRIALPGRKKVAIADCIRTTDLISYAPLTEKCTFPSTLEEARQK